MILFRSQKYTSELPSLSTKYRKESQVPKFLAAITKGNVNNNNSIGVERPIGQILRILEKSNIADFHCFWLLDGLGILMKVINEGLKGNSDYSHLAVTKAIQLYRNSSSSCTQIARHSILAGSLFALLDALALTIEASLLHSTIILYYFRNFKL